MEPSISAEVASQMQPYVEHQDESGRSRGRGELQQHTCVRISQIFFIMFYFKVLFLLFALQEITSCLSVQQFHPLTL